MMEINIISAQHIKPSSPTPPQLQTFKLSFIDENVPHFYIPIILYYQCEPIENKINVATKPSEISNMLKKSLAECLTQYYPLAGRVGHDGISVNCNDHGVYYIEAQANARISDIIGCKKVQILDQLIPEKILCNHGNDAKELLIIQVSHFSCGGVAIGCCISHKISDGCSLGNFVKHWADKTLGVDQTTKPEVSPAFSGATLFPVKEPVDFWRNSITKPIPPPPERLVVKMYVFTAQAIAEMKAKVMKLSPSLAKPTRVEVVTALLWKFCTSAKATHENYVKSAAFHPVNLRKHLGFPLPRNSVGNFFQMSCAAYEINASDQSGWIHLVEKLREAKQEINGEHIKRLRDENGTDLCKKNFRGIGDLLRRGNVHVFLFSSWCRFALDEADFGWGKPNWLSGGKFDLKDNILLLDSCEFHGGIEAWIAMADKDIVNLEQNMELQAYTSLYSPS